MEIHSILNQENELLCPVCGSAQNHFWKLDLSEKVKGDICVFIRGGCGHWWHLALCPIEDKIEVYRYTDDGPSDKERSFGAGNPSEPSSRRY
jgi:hypothetical protein